MVVIVVTRLNGPHFAVNPDLVQRIDSAPDTILTLMDGTKYIVQEDMATVIDLVVDYRARLVARAQELQAESMYDQTTERPSGLSVVPTLTDDERS